MSKTLRAVEVKCNIGCAMLGGETSPFRKHHISVYMPVDMIRCALLWVVAPAAGLVQLPYQV